MKAVFATVFSLGILFLIAIFVAFGLSIWFADSRWSQMGVLLIMPSVMLLAASGVIALGDA